ncbi:MAG TPA: hypothetical protein VNX01_09335 [Bacteroidia bacterium]|nr:hypothetical protein [Bacteroidia bacterium]
MKKPIHYIICGLLLLSVALYSISCRAKKPRDCGGRRKTAKTEMGGWL